MQGMDGLETLRKLRELDPHAQVVMISGHGTIQTAVEATQLGAYDFLEKPLDTDRILLTLRNALQHLDLESENVRLKAEVHAQYEIVGSSKAIQLVIERIEKVAPTAARVLITGENGTGKELVARAIHALSPRARGPFVEVKCAAIPSVPIEVPPLRARRSDIPQLLEHFMEQLTRRGGLPRKELDQEAMKRLASYDWPGNIRELRNAVERLLILTAGPVVRVEEVERLAGMAADGGPGRGTGRADLAGAPWSRAATFEQFKQAAERAYLLAKLQENDWNVSETARTLEMPRSNLYKKIERYGLTREA